jgi:hypothetical protein
MHVLDLAARKGGDEPAEVLQKVGRTLGHAREPRFAAKFIDEARLPE